MSELKKEYPTISFDAIKDEDDAYYESLGDERESNEKVADRARELFSWLKDRPETNIAVVRIFFGLFVYFLRTLFLSFLPSFRCIPARFMPRHPHRHLLCREYPCNGAAVNVNLML